MIAWPQFNIIFYGQEIKIVYTALNSPSLILALLGLRLIFLGLNSPTLQFSYKILSMQFNWPSFKFTLRSESEKGENKTGVNFSLYTVW